MKGVQVIRSGRRDRRRLRLGLVKIFPNVAKFGSGFISFDVVDAIVDGTFRIPFENPPARACWS